jgi:lambda family phage tail tape measure protein
MSGISIELKVGSAGAKQALGEVKSAVREVGQAAKENLGFEQLRDAVGRFTAVGNAAAEAAEGVRKMTDEEIEFEAMLAAGTDQLARQKSILDSLKGPLDEYGKNLQAADALLEKGAISVNEYADAVARMNRELQRARPSDFAGAVTAKQEQFGPVFDPARAGVGGAGGGGSGGPAGLTQMLAGGMGGPGGLSSMASGMSVAAVGAAALAVALVKVGDEYTTLTNSVQRFATSYRSADEIVRDQLQLAGELHGSLAETNALSLRAAEVGDAANLSYAQQNTLTKALAESMQLSGRSMGEATGVMDKLVFAMDQGQLSGRELRSIMRADPVLAESWEKFFGTTGAGLLKMANDGKLSAQDLVAATEAASTDIAAKHAQLAETAGQAWQHFKDQAVVAFGQIGQSFSDTAKGILADMGKLADSAGQGASLLGKLKGAYDDTIGKMPGVKMMGPMGILGVGDNGGTGGTSSYAQMRDTLMKQLGDEGNGSDASMLKGSIDPWLDTVRTGAVDVGKMSSALQTLSGAQRDAAGAAGTLLSAFLGNKEATRDVRASVEDWVQQLVAADPWLITDAEHVDALSNAINQGTFSIGKWVGAFVSGGPEKVLKDLGVTIKEFNGQISEEQRLLDELTRPQREFAQGMIYIEDLMKRGKITAQEYYGEYEKLLALDAKNQNTHGAGMDVNGNVVMPTNSRVGAASLGSSGGDTKGADWSKVALEASQQLVPAMVETNKQFEQLEQSMKRLETPTEKFYGELKKISDAQSNMLVGPDITNKAMIDLDQRTIGKAFNVDAAETYQTQLKALDDLNGRLHLSTDQLAQTQDKLRLEFLQSSGEARTMAGGFEVAFLQLKEEASNTGAQVGAIFKQVTGDISKSIADLVMGTKINWKSMVDSLLQDMIKLMTNQAFKALLGDGGGGASGGFNFLGGSSSGGGGSGGFNATGAAQMLTKAVVGGFAGGGEFTVAGQGGTDSQLVAFRATPGERVSVATPAQQMGDGGGLGGRGLGAPAVQAHIHLEPGQMLRALDTPGGERSVSHISVRAVGPLVGLRSRNRG